MTLQNKMWWLIPWVMFILLPDGTGIALVDVYPRVITPGQPTTVTYQGPFGTNAELYLHYGFNGWNLTDSGLGFYRDLNSPNVGWHGRVRMQWRWDYQRHTVTIAVPDSARALHMAFCWEDCRLGKWDNNFGEDYNYAIRVPYLGPMLHLADGDDPTTTVRVRVWHPQSLDTWLEYWPEGEPEAAEQVISLRGQHHDFKLAGLSPGKRYIYRLYTDFYGASATYSFRTMESHPVKLTFALLGDAQEDGEAKRLTRTVKALQSMPEVSFIVGMGDYPWSSTPGDWWTFFDEMGPLLAKTPFLPAKGNHDDDGKGSFERYLGPANSHPSYRSWKIGPARLLVLDTNITEHGIWQEQLDWLEQQVAALSAEDSWSFVVGHHPGLQVARRHYGENGRLNEIAERTVGKVDWRFAGHAHMYQRSKALTFFDGNYQAANADESGTRLLIIPPAGAAPEKSLGENLNRYLFAYPDPQTSPADVVSEIGFVLVSLSGENYESITVETYLEDPESGQFTVQDRISYQKERL